MLIISTAAGQKAMCKNFDIWGKSHLKNLKPVEITDILIISIVLAFLEYYKVGITQYVAIFRLASFT